MESEIVKEYGLTFINMHFLLNIDNAISAQQG